MPFAFAILNRNRAIFKKLLFLALALAICTGWLMSSVRAAAQFASGYVSTDSGLRPGMAASLSPSSTPDKPTVTRATTETIGKLIGIAVQSEDSLVTLASAEQQVYIQTSGVVSAYVSDLSGAVKKGDPLTVSPLQGILTKADLGAPVMGSALEDFKSDNAETQTIKSNKGDTVTRVSKISISLDTKPSAGRTESSLQHLGHTIGGKQVGGLQVVVALIITFLVLIAEGSIIYGSVTSAITSIGRNPMAKSIIRGELMHVLIVAIIVLLIGLGAVEAVLRI